MRIAGGFSLPCRGGQHWCAVACAEANRRSLPRRAPRRPSATMSAELNSICSGGSMKPHANTLRRSRSIPPERPARTSAPSSSDSRRGYTRRRTRSFPLKDAAAVLHPSERLIAYHLFWEDDIDFPEDNDPCDHEVVWVQFSRDRQSIERFWTYFHGRILEGGEDALRDARRHEMRPRVNVQWGKHGSMPLGWESMTIVGDAGDLERAYYAVGKPITLGEYNRGTWQKLRKEGRRLIDHPMARRLQMARSLRGRVDALRRFLARRRPSGRDQAGED